ncbi:MAG TPA: hypothetical protein VHE14_04790 [Solirubrobacteraceae bacterium]|nr:hypothetical protein [Solirubrobacteraceae bacterium]
MRATRLWISAVCATGALLVPATAMAAPTAHSAALAFTGATDQCGSNGCGAVEIDVSNNLRSLSLFSIQYVLSCESGKIYPSTDVFQNVPARYKRKRKTLVFKGNSAPYTIALEGGLTGNAKADVHGVVRRGAGFGVFQADVLVVNSAGQQIDKCTTGFTPINFLVSFSGRT